MFERERENFDQFHFVSNMSVILGNLYYIYTFFYFFINYEWDYNCNIVQVRNNTCERLLEIVNGW